MRKNEVIYTGPLTGTIGEAKEQMKGKTNLNEEFGEEFDAIQQTYRINPADEADYKGKMGFKDA